MSQLIQYNTQEIRPSLLKLCFGGYDLATVIINVNPTGFLLFRHSESTIFLIDTVSLV